MKRKIIQIDEARCNGCGQCVHACHEGAIEMVDGKARLVSDTYCDGLGDCIGECPVDAIRIIERDAEVFDPEAVTEHLAEKKEASKPAPEAFSGCPGLMAKKIDRPAEPPVSSGASGQSALGQWPVQLHLLNPQAPYFAESNLLVAADCVAFAMGDFHDKLLQDHSVAIACPKLDDTGPYVEKLAGIFASNHIRSLDVAVMEVPCCGGLVQLVEAAAHKAGAPGAYTLFTIALNGAIRSKETRLIK